MTTRNASLVPAVMAAFVVVLVLGNAAFADLAVDLVGYWRFEEVTAEGLYLDYSASENHGRAGERQLLGTAPSIVAGVAGNALHVGGNDFVWTLDSSPVSGTAARSVNLWFKPDYLQTQAPLCMGSDGEGMIFDLYMNVNGAYGGHFYGTSYDTLEDLSTGLNPLYDPAQWTMATLVYDGNLTVSVYHNGQFFKSVDMPGQLNTAPTSICFGGANSAGYSATRDYEGSIDEVALWSRMLSSDEIEKVYTLGQSGQPIPEPGTIALLLAAVLSLVFPRHRSG